MTAVDGVWWGDALEEWNGEVTQDEAEAEAARRYGGEA